MDLFLCDFPLCLWLEDQSVEIHVTGGGEGNNVLHLNGGKVKEALSLFSKPAVMA